MKRKSVLLALVCFGLSLFSLAEAGAAVIFTADTQIDAGNTSYDNQDIIVDGCTLTVNGQHSFGNLSLINSGKLTHSQGVAGCALTINGNLTVPVGTAISLDSKGFTRVAGLGAGTTTGGNGSGAGHGGIGGKSSVSGGPSYGTLLSPDSLGSGGGNGYSSGGGNGGGAIVLTINEVVQLDGSITAKGANGGLYSSVYNHYGGGGGSGGSIHITSGSLTGSGTINADGGAGAHIAGGGGGGRVALYCTTDTFTGSSLPMVELVVVSMGAPAPFCASRLVKSMAIFHWTMQVMQEPKRLSWKAWSAWTA